LRATNGIGSGEKLIELIANPVRDKDGNLLSGHTDQRLLVNEPEFAAILTVNERTGSTLSPTMRKLYDGVPINHEVKKGSTHAEGYHLSVVAAITPGELRRLLTDTSIANGFANRFQWLAGVDSIDIPLAVEEFPESKLHRLRNRLGENITKALNGDPQLRWSRPAAEGWTERYPALKRPSGPESIRDLLARGSNHTVKMSGLYALADGQTTMTVEHLDAATAWARFSDETVRWVYTAAGADEWTRRILEVIRARPGIPVNVSQEIHRQAFSGPKRPTASEIWARIDQLQQDGWAHAFDGPGGNTGGRPSKLVVGTKPREHEE
jgi:hypothetical protein